MYIPTEKRKRTIKCYLLIPWRKRQKTKNELKTEFSWTLIMCFHSFCHPLLSSFHSESKNLHARIFFEWPRGIPNHAKTILCCQLRKFENQYLYPVSRNDISYKSLILNPRSQPFKKGLIIDENCELHSIGSMKNDKRFCVLQNSIYGIFSFISSHWWHYLVFKI